MVGLQNHPRYGEQARVLRLIPGRGTLSFPAQFGLVADSSEHHHAQMPRAVTAAAQPCRWVPASKLPFFFAGQTSGRRRIRRVGGDGLAGGKQRRAALAGRRTLPGPPRRGLQAPWRDGRHFGAETKNYQPVNITFALLEPLSAEQARSVRRKRDRHLLQIKLALEEWDQWLQTVWKEREPILVAAS